MNSKPASSLCSSCKKRNTCKFFLKYASSEGEDNFSIEILECDDFE